MANMLTANYGNERISAEEFEGGQRGRCVGEEMSRVPYP